MFAALISLYSLVVLATVLLSWFPAARGTQVAGYLEAVTEPVFERVRRVVPPLAGFDLSPMLVLFALQVLRRILA